MSAAGVPFCNVCKCELVTDGRPALEHYKTDWHRYNVKLQVAGGVPISEDDFMQKYLALKRKLEAQLEVQEEQRCDVCRKTFQSQNAYEQHLKSKTHLRNVKHREERKKVSRDAEDPAAVSVSAAAVSVEDEDAMVYGGEEEEEEDRRRTPPAEREPIPTNVCLFCNFQSRTVRNNIRHMMKEHGFFVPFVEYCVDLEGLLEYLGYKVGVGHICIWCNGRGRAAYGSREAVQQHMLMKSHCKIGMDETLEYKEQELANIDGFSSDDDDEDGIETDDGEDADPEKQQTPNRPKYGGLEALEEFEDEDEDDDGVYDDDDDDLVERPSPDEYLPFYRFPGQVDIVEDLDEDGKPVEREIIDVTPEERERTQELYPETIPEPQAKGERTLVDIADSQELILSDGSIIGHRQYNVIYRQNLRETKRGQLIQSLVHQRRGANQGQLMQYGKRRGGGGVSDMDRTARREQEKAMRSAQRNSNQTRRHHFRWQLLMF